MLPLYSWETSHPSLSQQICGLFSVAANPRRDVNFLNISGTGVELATGGGGGVRLLSHILPGDSRADTVHERPDWCPAPLLDTA